MLLGLSGSLRADSTNRKLIREAARHYGDDFVEGEIRMPLYDGDVEQEKGVPQAAETLAEQIDAAEAVVISTPEYNQSFSGSLKNALDWVSRVKGNPWQDKPVLLLSAASGRSGGARANYALRLAMTPFRPRLLTQELMVANARNQFDENGHLTSDQYEKELSAHVAKLKASV